MDSRPSFDEYYLNMAKVASTRGDCTRSQVGAVLVIQIRGTHIAVPGYNGTKAPKMRGCLDGGCPRGLLNYSDLPSNDDYSNCTSVHAEMNALKRAEVLGWTFFAGSTIYITRAPCADCQREARQHHVDRMVWPEGEVTFP